MNRVNGQDSLDFPACPWVLKDVFIVFVYSIVLFLVFCFWLTLIYVVLKLITGDSFYPLVVFMRHLKGTSHLYAVILFYGALFVAMNIKIFRKYNVKVFKFFIKREALKQDIVYGIAMYLKFLAVMLLFVILIFLVANMCDMVFQSRIVEQVNIFFTAYHLEKISRYDYTMMGIAGILILSVLAPFFEELFFRGCLYTALRKNVSSFAAIVVTSLVFSLLHGYFFVFMYVFLVGLLLAYMYEKKKSLVAPLVFHMLNNLLVAVFFFG